MTELELLSPAKNLETGVAAITHGADAVYIAANKFGAREKAGNSLEDIQKLVTFAHQFHARVYVTVNTIFLDNELKQVEDLINELYHAKVDAIIIQDFSILGMKIPPIALHASTQMHNNTVDKVKFLESYGINRVVLPREFSLEQIAEFHKHINSEIEFFIHGALCVCYSGQCYMSQGITGRSANRGTCAQPCRSAYNLIDEDGNLLVKNKHLLSLKDLNLSNHIGNLIENGVTSFKIEGRLKDIQYVKNITAYYNQIINQYIKTHTSYKRQSEGNCTYAFTPDPERSFNRGFTSHFIFSRQAENSSMRTQKSIGKPLGKIVETGKNWIKIDSPETIHPGDGLCYFEPDGLKGFAVNRQLGQRVYLEQTAPPKGTMVYRNSDHAFEKMLGGNSSKRAIPATITVKQASSNIIFSIADNYGNSSQIEVPNGFEPASNKESALKSLTDQLSKSGNTIFTIDKIDTSDYSTPAFIPISELNSIRRDLLDNLLKSRIESYKVQLRSINRSPIAYPDKEVDHRANISNKMSRNLLENNGTIVIEPAFEIQQPKLPVELMTTRYCIKFELNMCPNRQNAKPTKQLYLQDNHHKYPLVFDCKNCQMKVILDK